MARTGRPESLDYAKIIGQYEQFGALGLKFKDIAHIFSVTPQTITRYNKMHPELLLAYRKGRARSTSGIKKAAVSKALKGDTTMIKYCLRNLSDWHEDAIIDNSEHNHITVLIKTDDNSSAAYNRNRVQLSQPTKRSIRESS